VQGSWPDSLFCYPIKELGTARLVNKSMSLLPTVDRVYRTTDCLAWRVLSATSRPSEEYDRAQQHNVTTTQVPIRLRF
jgi:hypothetical protein